MDYTAKLNFEDFDEDEAGSQRTGNREEEIAAWKEEKERRQEKNGSQSRDAAPQHGPPSKMQQVACLSK